jgi:hypothetical protein
MEGLKKLFKHVKGLTTFRPSVKDIKGFEFEAGNNQP